MSVKRLDIEDYLKYDYNDLLVKMTDNEIDKVAEWCNKLINEQQKIENNIINKVEDIMTEARDKLDEFYQGAFDTDFMNFNREDLFDGYGVERYTIETALKKLRPDFPFFENLDKSERKKMINILINSLRETGAYWN